MVPFNEFRVGNKHFPEHLKWTTVIGFTPILVSLCFMFGKRIPGPGLYCALAVSIGFLLILRGGYSIHIAKQRCTRFTEFLVNNTDNWFPYFFYAIRYIFACILFVLVWRSVKEMGMTQSLIQNINIYLLFLINPTQRVLTQIVRQTGSVLVNLYSEICRNLKTMLFSTLIGITLTHFSIRPGKGYSGEFPIVVVIIWIPCTLAIIASLILLIDSVILFRSGSRTTRSRRAHDSVG